MPYRDIQITMPQTIKDEMVNTFLITGSVGLSSLNASPLAILLTTKMSSTSATASAGSKPAATSINTSLVAPADMITL
ncbi:hypothetical protein D3C72_2030300 [compost metagenome]